MLYSIIAALALACSTPAPPAYTINTSGTTVTSRFPAPEGFSRTDAEQASFAHYLRSLPLKPHGSKVLLFDGAEKYAPSVHAAVVDQPISARDLQQCADAVMRLRGEFLFEQQRYADIHFNFLSDGKPRHFSSYAKGDYSYKRFRSYMDWVFAFANTRSLHAELQPVPWHDLQAGDVLIQTGNPFGHAVTVMDVVVNHKTGEKRFLLSQSYMPAQETHVLNNPSNRDGSPWYSTLSGPSINTPEWTFEKSDLRRFTE